MTLCLAFLQEILLNHTFNAGQIAWFKAGSALNHMKVRKALVIKKNDPEDDFVAHIPLI